MTLTELAKEWFGMRQCVGNEGEGKVTRSLNGRDRVPRSTGRRPHAGLGLLAKSHARGCQLNAAGVTRKESHAKLSLQPADLPRQRRLGIRQSLRSPAKVHLFGQNQERLQQPEVVWDLARPGARDTVNQANLLVRPSGVVGSRHEFRSRRHSTAADCEARQPANLPRGNRLSPPVSTEDSRFSFGSGVGVIQAGEDPAYERDLHDGAQQRLVRAVIVLKLALQALSNGDAGAGDLVTEALRHAEQANSELRELAHGILPAALTRGGLRAGVGALLSRVSLPVSVDVFVERLPASVEATAYFVISEALTNAVKHARAAGAEVTGLGGLEDRVSALDGRLVLESPPGGGTRVCVLLPVPAEG
jgi:hypothetical protein